MTTTKFSLGQVLATPGAMQAMKESGQEAAFFLKGQDISQLRKDQNLRELVQEHTESVKVVLDTLVEDAPARQIVLRD